jgi:hypothetical protein
MWSCTVIHTSTRLRQRWQSGRKSSNKPSVCLILPFLRFLPRRNDKSMHKKRIQKVECGAFTGSYSVLRYASGNVHPGASRWPIPNPSRTAPSASAAAAAPRAIARPARARWHQRDSSGLWDTRDRAVRTRWPACECGKCQRRRVSKRPARVAASLRHTRNAPALSCRSRAPCSNLADTAGTGAMSWCSVKRYLTSFQRDLISRQKKERKRDSKRETRQDISDFMTPGRCRGDTRNIVA